MSVLYRLYQDTRKKKGTDTPLNAKTYNKWFARAVYTGTIESRDIAEKIAYSASATVADTLSVINALVTVMGDNLKEGFRVKLDGFGTWKVGISSKPADQVKNFSANKNIVGAHVMFHPEYTIDNASGKAKTPMLLDCKVQETAINNV